MTGETVPVRDHATLRPGSLGLSSRWAIFKAERRPTGAAPINFYRRARHDDLAATRTHLDGEYQKAALGGVKDPEVKTNVTLTAYAKTRSIGPRKARKIMRQLGFLQPEIEVREVPMFCAPSLTRPIYRSIPRLASWALAEGFGKRIEPRGGFAFDVLSPEGVKWLDDHWPVPTERPKVKRGRPPTGLRGQVQSLMSEGHSQVEIARQLGKSRQAINRQVQALRMAA